MHEFAIDCFLLLVPFLATSISKTIVLSIIILTHLVQIQQKLCYSEIIAVQCSIYGNCCGVSVHVKCKKLLKGFLQSSSCNKQVHSNYLCQHSDCNTAWNFKHSALNDKDQWRTEAPLCKII